MYSFIKQNSLIMLWKSFQTWKWIEFYIYNALIKEKFEILKRNWKNVINKVYLKVFFNGLTNVTFIHGFLTETFVSGFVLNVP